MKRLVGVILVVLVVALVVWFAVSFFEVDTVGDVDMPDVDVQVEGGEIPEMEVRGPDIEIGTEEVDVPVPDVDVDVEERRVTVPSVGVERPGEEEDVVPR